MKKYALFLIIGFLSFTGIAQNNNGTLSNKKTEKTQATIDKTPNNDVAMVTATATITEPVKVKEVVAENKSDFVKIKVIESYERVLEKGYKTEAMLTKVADYRFFDGDLVTAAKWYSQLFEFCPEELEAVYFYRYSKSLESIDQIEKAKEMMAIYQIKKI